MHLSHVKWSDRRLLKLTQIDFSQRDWRIVVRGFYSLVHPVTLWIHQHVMVTRELIQVAVVNMSNFDQD
jgi:hypothetical protein